MFLEFAGLTLTINNLNIKNCYSTSTGALMVSKRSVVTLNNCTFKDNLGNDKGGAITNRHNLTVNNCTFIHNLAKEGANIWSTGTYSSLKINNSYFCNNDTKDTTIQNLYGSIHNKSSKCNNIQPCL